QSISTIRCVLGVGIVVVVLTMSPRCGDLNHSTISGRYWSTGVHWCTSPVPMQRTNCDSGCTGRQTVMPGTHHSEDDRYPALSGACGPRHATEWTVMLSGGQWSNGCAGCSCDRICLNILVRSSPKFGSDLVDIWSRAVPRWTGTSSTTVVGEPLSTTTRSPR